MSKKCVLVDSSTSVIDLMPQIDWVMCILCQQQTREVLVDPAKSFGMRCDKDVGYRYLADVLPKFYALGELPPHLQIPRIIKSECLVDILKSNGAKWHKSCRGNYTARQLDRKSTSAEKRGSISENNEAECEGTANETVGNKRICTRSEFNSQNPLRVQTPVCFFCDMPETSRQPLHAVSTVDSGSSVDKHVRECATILSDARLIAKLSEGDMVAVEAKYHSTCLCNLYNRRRTHETEILKQSGTSQCNSHDSIAFAELAAYISDIRQIEEVVPIFKLADLKRMYTDRLQQLNPKFVPNVNSTRLKENLLDHFNDMSAHNDGRDIVFAFDGGVGSALSKACFADADSDAVHLAKAAEIIRRNLFDCDWTFTNTLCKESQERSVPDSLLTLINFILEGPSIDVQLSNHVNPAALSIAQLMVFNSVRRIRSTTSHEPTVVRHAKDRETPLPLYIGLAVHAVTRKKCLVEKLNSLGISVSYNRVLSVQTDLANDVCKRFESDNAVCPANFKDGLFTTAAVDNLDHNPSSTSSHNSFHGTCISLHQHPESGTPGFDRIYKFVGTTTSNHALQLPASYTFVPTCKLLQQEPSITCMEEQSLPTNQLCLPDEKCKSEQSWLDSIWDSWQAGNFTCEVAGSFFSWSAYHAQQCVSTSGLQPVSLCGMLPLFHEHAQSVSMIRHAMEVVRASVDKLNPSQIPVIAFDQPLYTLAKLIQWNWPDTYGESKFVVMFGGLHIEMAALKAVGSLLTGSGWVEAITESGILSSGSAEGLLSASHVRRCRHMHELTLVALYILQKKAYDHDCERESLMTFDDWCKQQCTKHRQFAFWSSIMKLQTAILLFVRSLRKSDFAAYVSALVELMPWFFALDRINYARWLSMHIRDMQTLPITHADIYSEFLKGKFTANKTGNRFSALPLDHVHEQLNAVVKGDGGIVGITDNESALTRWIVSGPEVARLITEFESTSETDTVGPHHEQSFAVQQAFVRDVKKLVECFERMGNPFEDQTDLIVLHNRYIVTDDIADQAGNLYDIGKDQYEAFVSDRIKTSSTSLFAPIKKNKFAFFVKSRKSPMAKLKSKLVASRNDASLFSRLYIACQIRNSNLDQFFCHENQPYPPALSSSGDLNFGCKSDLLTCLESCSPSIQTEPKVDGIILDGSAIVNMLKPSNVKNFGEYVDSIFMPFLYSQLSKADRVDVVFDRYETASIKGLARLKRGVAQRQQVGVMAPIPRNWHDFLRCDQNKVALFNFLTEQMCIKQVPAGKMLIGTHDTNVRCSLDCYDTAFLEPCNQEEADTRMLLHAADVIADGKLNIIIRTVDTDVVVLTIAFFQKLACEQLLVAFGVGKHFRYIPIHDLVISMGPQQAVALPMFHALTGCDTASAFVGRGKKTCWEIWKKCPQVTDTFIELFETPQLISDNMLKVLQHYVILLYDANSQCENVNVARKKLFSNKGKSIENIPPTFDALEQHIRRAVYQAGHVWSQSLVPEPQLPSPTDWGWQLDENNWTPLWMTIPDAANCCPELKRCGCKTGCLTKRCKCVKDNIPCTALCACDGECRK